MPSGASSGTNTSQRIPADRAAYASACAWLPALPATTPSALPDSERTLLSAPRSLKDPVRCRFSAFSAMVPPHRSDRLRVVSTGVARTRVGAGGADRLEALGCESSTPGDRVHCAPIVGCPCEPPPGAQGRSWGLRFRMRERLDRSWLVIPSLYVVAALVLGKTVPALESGHRIDPFALALSTHSAREILNAVAGGMIAFTGLVVSVAVVVVQFGAGQYTPRLVLRFRRDLVVKHALGIFIAPALYALVALAQLGERAADLEPNLTVGLAVLLLVAAVLRSPAWVARLLDLLRPRRLFEQLLRGL